MAAAPALLSPARSKGPLPARVPRATATHDVIHEVSQPPDDEKAAQGEQQSVPGHRGDLRESLGSEDFTALTQLLTHLGALEVTETLPGSQARARGWQEPISESPNLCYRHLFWWVSTSF